MMKTVALAAAAVAFSVSTALAGDVYTVDATHSETSFQIRHMMGKVRGVFNDFSGTIDFDRQKPEASSVEFRIKTGSINTSNERRDTHLKSADFFDAANHPEIVFKSSKIVAKGGDAFDVHGTLTMRGVTKEIVLPVKYLGEAKDPMGAVKASFETNYTLNRKDYNIVWNRALDSGGLLLGDDVEVTINLETTKQAPAPATK